jgi:protein-glutamine gamma-glutamyltransferase
VRLVVFTGFAAYGATHWAMLVTAPSAAMIVATVAAAVACAAALALLERSQLPRRAVLALAALAVLAAFAIGLIATGIAPRLLLPTGWGELADQLDHALLGIQGVDWPYDGPDEWIRVTILLGAPLLLTTAAALAFWPASPETRPPLRGAALVLLIAVYALAVTTNSPGSPSLFGALLLVLIAAWLWLPRRGVREWTAGAIVVGATALLALPAAAALDGDGPWLDYRSWSPFGDDTGIAFSWDHSYGPLDWPRQGTTLLNVRSERPHYWKAETLNSFDGVHWYRATGDDRLDLSAELPFDPDGVSFDAGTWSYGELNPDWNDEIQFTVRSLSTELLVGAGLTYDVVGAAAVPSADGTTQLLDPLARGDSYTVRSYQPNPTPIVMAGAPEGYPDWVERYTELSLPGARGADVETVVVPPRGNRARAAERAAAKTALAGSVYGRMYELAVGLTGGGDSTYDAVAAIATHLRDSYRYNEDVPQHAYPLESFLFEDRQGYCQQFSGAMALMLRMVGIPARVAAGFSPGTLNRKTGEYRVRDLDAHSWVEVYFSGIGWVTFDPTPRATESGSAGAPAASGASAAAGEIQQSSVEPEPVPDANAAADGAGGDSGASDGASTQSSSGDRVPTVLVVLAAGLAAIALAAAVAFVIRVRRRDALDREQLTAAEIAELRRALDRLGWDVAPATTLLALEQQLAATAGPRAASYARALRDCRFDPRRGDPPSPADRRALRRALGDAAGPLGPLRALIALPPG